jgi:hypothetical protein
MALIAQIIVLAPWAVRNYYKLGAWIPVSTYGGTNFYKSNNPICLANKGAVNESKPVFEEEAIADMKKLPEVEGEKYAWQRGWQFLRSHPMAIPYLVYRRTLLFWDPSIQLSPPFDVRKTLIDGGYVLIFILSLAAVWYCQERKVVWFYLLWCLNFSWSVLLFSPHPRYRQLLDPALIILAGIGGCEVIRQHKRGKAIVIGLATIAVLMTLFSRQILELLRAAF